MLGLVLMCEYFLAIGFIANCVVRRPWILLRPSVWVVAYMTVIINGAAAFVSESYAYTGGFSIDALDGLWLFRFLSLLFPLLIVLLVNATPRINEEAKNIYEKSLEVGSNPYQFRKRNVQVFLAISAVAAVMLGIYLWNVPVHSTGLWAIIYDPGNSDMAREEAFKLIDSSVVRYSYTWYTAVAAPIIIGLLFQFRGRFALNARNLIIAIAICLLTVTVMLTGERAPIAKVLVLLGLILLLHRGALRGGKVLAGLAVSGLALVALMSIMREGRIDQLTFESFWEAFSKGILERLFVTPFITGIYTNIFAQDFGLLGVQNIRPLAALLGIDYQPLANTAALYSIRGALFSINMNTSFLFDFQASFGFWPGLTFALIALGLLDLLVFAFRKLSGALLVATYAALMLSLMALGSTAYFVSLNSHGIIWIALAAFFIGELQSKSLTLVRTHK